MTKVYLLHPVSVHFPIALLTVGFLAEAAGRWLAKPAWLSDTARGLLILGVAGAWTSMGLGLWAANTVPHVPAAAELLMEHRNLGYGTVSAFTGLLIWSLVAPDSGKKAFLVAWLAALGLLAATADHGGDLVYKFSVGTTLSIPEQ